MNNTETLNETRSNTSETRRLRGILRSVGAVFAGVLTVFILSLGTDVLLHATGIYPPWFQPMSNALFLVATAYRIVYGILGGYIAARLALDRPMLHALALGVVGLILSIAGAVGTWNAGPEFGPRWYPLALVVTALPCAWLGGRIRMKQQEYKPC
jgi:surface polysaccharide O-acyltransferase-like enzyme